MVLFKVYVVIAKDADGNIERVKTFSKWEAANTYAHWRRVWGNTAEVHITHLDSGEKHPSAVVSHLSPFYDKVK